MSNTAEVITGATSRAEAAPITPAFRKLVIASSLGSVIEHYDFFIYAFTAPIVFDRFFFPKMDSTASMLAVYATFAVGFVARPLGGMVFGHYGDQLGRKAMLTITFVLMGVASFLIGCLPSYDSIGLLAPIALVALRFVQGFAFGGEYMNAVSLTLENAPSARRGFFASFVNASGPIGVILASGFIALLGFISTPQDFAQWVWRVPFVLSLVLVVLGTYIRLQVDESTLFKAVQASAARPRAPLLDVARSWKKSVLFGCLANMAHSTFQYMSTVFVLGYAVKSLGMAQSSVTFGTMVANVLEMCMVPLIAAYPPPVHRARHPAGGGVVPDLLPARREQGPDIARHGPGRLDRNHSRPDVRAGSSLHGGAVSDGGSRQRLLARQAARHHPGRRHRAPGRHRPDGIERQLHPCDPLLRGYRGLRLHRHPARPGKFEARAIGGEGSRRLGLHV